MSKKFKINTLILTSILMLFMSSCEKWPWYNDLFPLEPGNEFYFTYHEMKFSGAHIYTDGNETWKVVSCSTVGDTKKYLIERKLNGILKFVGITIISDSIRYEYITENKSSLISMQGISFKRYQSESQIEIKKEHNSVSDGYRYLFKADSGLTLYSYYHPPNHVHTINMKLDSMKIYP